MTATKEKYRAIVDSFLIDLKDAGYRRRGNLFWKDNADVRFLIEPQRSQKSSETDIVFTINISIVVKALLDPEIENLEKMRAYEGHLFWRVGDFISPKEDKWWTVGGEIDSSMISQEISHLISEEILPEIEKYSSVNAIISLWNSSSSPRMSDKRRVDLLRELKNLS